MWKSNRPTRKQNNKHGNNNKKRQNNNGGEDVVSTSSSKYATRSMPPDFHYTEEKQSSSPKEPLHESGRRRHVHFSQEVAESQQQQQQQHSLSVSPRPAAFSLATTSSSSSHQYATSSPNHHHHHHKSFRKTLTSNIKVVDIPSLKNLPTPKLPDFPIRNIPKLPNFRRRSSTGVQTTKAAVRYLEQLSQKSGTNYAQERFKVSPDYAYAKNTKFNRDELRKEMNKPSVYYHDLGNMYKADTTTTTTNDSIGVVHLEILQCFGIPRSELLKETSAFCIAICGTQVFKTDVMPPVANPMWLSKMRRACKFSIQQAYQNVMIGVFSQTSTHNTNHHHHHHQRGGGGGDAFIGRIELDLPRMRPKCTYDVTLPLRTSKQVYSRQQRGAIRIRIRLEYYSERQALLSYLPKRRLQLSDILLEFATPHERQTIHCCDTKAFQNVAKVVHGSTMPGKFSMKFLKATMREVQFLNIHVTRYLRKRVYRDLKEWRCPIISGFIFVAWMHSVYHGTLQYLPGHVVTVLLLYAFRNYALYAIDGKLDSGFVAPTVEEMAGALLLGGGGSIPSRPSGSTRQSEQQGQHATRDYIEPLEMVRLDPDDVDCASKFFEITNNPGGGRIANQDGNGTGSPTKPPSLQSIATALREGVKRNEKANNNTAPRKKNYSYLHGGLGATSGNSSSESNFFFGSDAVDFLVDNGYAVTRSRAVELAKLLQRELRLFEHVGKRKYDFKDASDYIYEFLNFDTSEYEFQTHKPWFRRICQKLGFYDDDQRGPPLSDHEAHWEFPFATGKDHPRFTIKEAVVIRSKESKNLLQTMQAEEEMEDCNDLGVTAYDRNFAQRQLQNLTGIETTGGNAASSLAGNTSVHGRDSASSLASSTTNMNGVSLEVELCKADHDFGETCKDNPDLTIKLLPPPPSQDVDIVEKGAKMSNVLVETKHKAHGYFGHLFHDRTYKLSISEKMRTGSSRSLKRKVSRETSSPRKNRSGATSPKRGNKRLSSQLPNEDMLLTIRKDEYDRLLQLSKYSHNNLIVSKVAVILQPILELIQLFLSVIRSLFNLFTWRDPFLTFWAVLFACVLVVILHLFPWRIVLGILGIYIVGPQNWILRLAREKRGEGPRPEDDLDVIVRRNIGEAKPGGTDDSHHAEHSEVSYFSSHTIENRPTRLEEMDMSDVKQVAIPHTPLNYRRFYDWPPEPAYARVWRSETPQNNPLVESQMMMDEDMSRNRGEISAGFGTDGLPTSVIRGSPDSKKSWSRAKRMLGGMTAARSPMRRRKAKGRRDEGTI